MTACIRVGRDTAGDRAHPSTNATGRCTPPSAALRAPKGATGRGAAAGLASVLGVLAHVGLSLAGAFCASVGLATAAAAQMSPAPRTSLPIPSTLDPALLPQNLPSQPRVGSEPGVSIPKSEGPGAPEGAATLTFTFRGLTIEGATVYSQAELAKRWPRAAGEKASVKDIFDFAEAVTQAYRQAGYALSFALVPQQKIPDGRFVVRVVEGFVDRVEISGLADGPVKSQMVRIAEHIKTSRPLKSADLERYLLLINDLPGVAMSALISPADVQGGALLTLNASHRRADGAASYLYNYMPLTVAEHLGEFTVRSQSVVTGSDLLSLTFRHSLADAAFGAVSADLSTGIGSDGLRVGLTGYFSNVSPNAPLLRQLEYDGRFVSGRVYAEYAVLRSREQNLRLGAAFGLDDNTSTLLGESLIDDRLREASVWGSYDFTDATGAVTSLKGKFAQGLEILDATGNSRADGNLQYSKFELDARRNQPLLMVAGGFLSLVGALHGQATVSPDGLFSSAECAYGGRAFGRAFDAGVITGAHCLMGSVELHWVKEISFPGFKDPVVFDVYPFVDGGEVWAKGSLQPGEVMSMTASSFGIDLNIQLMPKLFALFEIARELSLSEGTPDQGVRIVGALTVNF